MKTFIAFYKRIFLLLLLYSSSRVLFYFFNSDYFSDNILLSILEGVRFDISALFYINIPLLILLLFSTTFIFDLIIFIIQILQEILSILTSGVSSILSPIIKLLEYCRKINLSIENLKTKNWYQKMVNILFYIINIPFIIINNVDIEYFKFSQKRTTSDFFEYIALGGGADAFQVIPNYIIEFPNVTIIIIIQIFLLLKIKYLPKEKIRNVFIPFTLFILSVGIFVLGARGGIQLKPIKPIDAGILSNTQNSVLVLNSPFCILHTFLEKGLARKNYLSEDEIDKIYPTIHKFEGDFQKKNVLIIILESFSKEYVGYYNNGNGYTPFLDELISHSLVMENGYANGIKSIDALPAITSSVPTLMNEPFITSPYATNAYYSISSLLKEEGYSTSFFHGGTRGTMGFYQFSKKAGFDNYFGLEEYGGKKDYDGAWGIYDGPFFKYFLEHLNKEREPFISSIFSLTSHPPFTLPKDFENTFPKGELKTHETIGYTDFVLKEFFERAKKQEWYNNTLFVITADHTSPESKKSEYKNKVGRYSIPIVYFMGDTSEKGSVENITQQMDIMPTTLDLLGYNKQFFSFGKSIFSDENWAVSYLNNEYLLIHKDGFLIDRDNKKTNYSDRKLKNKTEENMKVNNFLNAIKQKYNNKLIDNKMNINEN